MGRAFRVLSGFGGVEGGKEVGCVLLEGKRRGISCLGGQRTVDFLENRDGWRGVIEDVMGGGGMEQGRGLLRSVFLGPGDDALREGEGLFGGCRRPEQEAGLFVEGVDGERLVRGSGGGGDGEFLRGGIEVSAVGEGDGPVAVELLEIGGIGGEGIAEVLAAGEGFPGLGGNRVDFPDGGKVLVKSRGWNCREPLAIAGAGLTSVGRLSGHDRGDGWWFRPGKKIQPCGDAARLDLDGWISRLWNDRHS